MVALGVSVLTESLSVGQARGLGFAGDTSA
jgi:hypothetical protein